MKMDFLFSLSEAETVRRNPEFSSRLEFCLEKTLGAMSQGSLVDHLHGASFATAWTEDGLRHILKKCFRTMHC